MLFRWVYPSDVLIKNLSFMAVLELPSIGRMKPPWIWLTHFNLSLISILFLEMNPSALMKLGIPW